MRTVEEINAEIANLKKLLSTSNIDADTHRILDGVVGELEWVVNSNQTISMSQLIAGAQALVNE